MSEDSVDGRIGGDPHHRAGDLDVVGGVAQFGPDAFGQRRFGVVDGGQDRCQRAVLRQQRGGGFLADTRNAGQSVGGVSPQQGQFGVACAGPVGGYAVTLGDFGRDPSRWHCSGPVLGRAPAPGPGRHRPPAAESRSPLTTTTGSRRSWAASVPITSSASKPSAPPVQRPNASRICFDHLDLRREIVGNFLDIGVPVRVFLFNPMGLVRRDAIDPELRAPVQIQADHQAAGTVPGDQGGHRIQKATDRVHRSAVGRGDRGRDAEVGPKPHAGAVEQQQRRGHARHPASRT